MIEVRSNAAALGAAHRLSLAAAPTFAAMALLTEAIDGGAADIVCAAAPGGLPVSGMTLMYALMSVFHAAPWIRLAAVRQWPARTDGRTDVDGQAPSA